MTRGSILEYSEAVGPRYKAASKEEKGKILDEFTKVTGLHRKSSIRLLKRVTHYRAGKRCGRPPEYGAEGEVSGRCYSSFSGCTKRYFVA